jgi:hypothetical protein
MFFDLYSFTFLIASPPNVRERVMRTNGASAMIKRRAITTRDRATFCFLLPSSPTLLASLALIPYPYLPRHRLHRFRIILCRLNDQNVDVLITSEHVVSSRRGTRILHESYSRRHSVHIGWNRSSVPVLCTFITTYDMEKLVYFYFFTLLIFFSSTYSLTLGPAPTRNALQAVSSC